MNQIRLILFLLIILRENPDGFLLLNRIAYLFRRPIPANIRISINSFRFYRQRPLLLETADNVRRHAKLLDRQTVIQLSFLQQNLHKPCPCLLVLLPVILQSFLPLFFLQKANKPPFFLFPLLPLNRKHRLKRLDHRSSVGFLHPCRQFHQSSFNSHAVCRHRENFLYLILRVARFF